MHQHVSPHLVHLSILLGLWQSTEVRPPPGLLLTGGHPDVHTFVPVLLSLSQLWIQSRECEISMWDIKVRAPAVVVCLHLAVTSGWLVGKWLSSASWERRPLPSGRPLSASHLTTIHSPHLTPHNHSQSSPHTSQPSSVLTSHLTTILSPHLTPNNYPQSSPHTSQPSSVLTSQPSSVLTSHLTTILSPHLTRAGPAGRRSSWPHSPSMSSQSIIDGQKLRWK